MDNDIEIRSQAWSEMMVKALGSGDHSKRQKRVERGFDIDPWRTGSEDRDDCFYKFLHCIHRNSKHLTH